MGCQLPPAVWVPPALRTLADLPRGQARPGIGLGPLLRWRPNQARSPTHPARPWDPQGNRHLPGPAACSSARSGAAASGPVCTDAGTRRLQLGSREGPSRAAGLPWAGVRTPEGRSAGGGGREAARRARTTAAGWQSRASAGGAAGAARARRARQPRPPGGLRGVTALPARGRGGSASGSAPPNPRRGQARAGGARGRRPRP